MRVHRFVLYGALLVAVLWSGMSSADILPANASGWHTWQVDEPGVSTEMCCVTRNRGAASRRGCDLDGRNMTFSDGGDCAATAGSLQVYVRLENGHPEDIRVLSSSCPVSTRTEVADHGVVTATENVGWFRSIIMNKKIKQDVREEALFSLVHSDSEAAYEFLEKLLTHNIENY